MRIRWQRQLAGRRWTLLTTPRTTERRRMVWAGIGPARDERHDDQVVGMAVWAGPTTVTLLWTPIPAWIATCPVLTMDGAPLKCGCAPSARCPETGPLAGHPDREDTPT